MLSTSSPITKAVTKVCTAPDLPNLRDVLQLRLGTSAVLLNHVSLQIILPLDHPRASFSIFAVAISAVIFWTVSPFFVC